jgi:hypothetical protein
MIDALVAIARGVVQEERARRRGHAYAHAEEKERARETLEFPDFDEICRACPSNYALPGDDAPADTVYVETFDFDFAQLERGFRYLREHARAAERNAAALENLWLLCLRLRGKPGETPREILERHGYDPGED